MINEQWVLLGALISLFGGASYIRDTLNGTVQPNRVSWGLWGVGVMVAFAAEVQQGVGIQALATFMVGFVPLCIFFASFVNSRAYWKITRLDVVCGALSLLGLLMWYLTRNGNTAILFSIFGDLMAGVPTLVKAYRSPESENWVQFLASAAGVSIALLTVSTWTFAYYAFPLYILCFDVAALVCIKKDTMVSHSRMVLHKVHHGIIHTR